MRRCTRSDDDAWLAVLAAKPGIDAVAAAAGFGIGASYASVIRQRVMADDLAESLTEDPARIRAAYYGGRA